MKAFFWAVVVCVAVSVSAGLILTGLDNDFQHAARTADSVRLY